MTFIISTQECAFDEVKRVSATRALHLDCMLKDILGTFLESIQGLIVVSDGILKVSMKVSLERIVFFERSL